MVRAPTQMIPSQLQPVFTEIEEALDTLFGDGAKRGTTLVITDRGEVPPGTDLERAIIDLGEELLRPPEIGRRVRRTYFDSDTEPVGAAHCRDTDHPNSQDRASPVHVSPALFGGTGS